MQFSIKFDTVKFEWHIYILSRGHRLYCFKKNSVFLSLKIDIVLGNIADPDEMSL